MSYKVTRANEAVPYEAKGHFDVLTTRLHNGTDVNEGAITVGLSHFLPGGGAEMMPANFELIYYIVSGEMTVTMDDGKEYVLHAGDSIHMGKGTGRASKNTGNVSAQMLVIMAK
jgi:quercetin dioxygenase-like cupin family protein